MHGQQTMPGQIQKKREREGTLSRIKDKASRLSPPPSFTAWCLNPTPARQISLELALFPWASDLDPASHGARMHSLCPWVSWLLPRRPRQIRHDECRLFAVWQTHSFTVGWCLQEGRLCATPSSERNRRKAREKKKEESEDGAHTGGRYDALKKKTELQGWERRREESIFPSSQVVRGKKLEWGEVRKDRTTKWAVNKGEIEKMHSAHSPCL